MGFTYVNKAFDHMQASAPAPNVTSNAVLAPSPVRAPAETGTVNVTLQLVGVMGLPSTQSLSFAVRNGLAGIIGVGLGAHCASF